MSLPLSKPPLSSLRLVYSGPVGVSGNAVQQAWSLAALPEGVRSAPAFKDSVLVLVQQVDPGVTGVAAAVSFLPATGTPDRLVLTLDALSSLSTLQLDVLCLHSITGLAAGSRACFFTKSVSSGAPSQTKEYLYDYAATGGVVTISHNLDRAAPAVTIVDVDGTLAGGDPMAVMQGYVTHVPPLRNTTKVDISGLGAVTGAFLVSITG